MILIFALLITAASAAPQNDLLRITFPALRDTVDAEYVRVSGGTDPSARVTLNGKTVRVYPSGAFAGRIALAPGLNRIVIHSQTSARSASSSVQVYRPPLLESSAKEPTAFDTRILEPAEDIWQLPGDLLRVRCKGSPGGKAIFSVQKMGDKYPMVERDGEVAGIYEGVVRVDQAPFSRPLRIRIKLKGIDNRSEQIDTPGRLIVLSDRIPLVGRTLEPATLHSSSSHYTPMGRIPEGVAVRITGKMGSRLRIRLSPVRNAYIDADTAFPLPLGTQPPQISVAAPSVTLSRDWIHLTMPVTGRAPFLVDGETSPSALDLCLYGARCSSHWITYPNSESELNGLRLSAPEEDVFQLHVDLDMEQRWGHRVYYDDEALHFLIRRKPAIAAAPASPCQGLIFAIDPGHGGDQTGAVGPTGVLEKDVNLIWARHLQSLLTRAGGRVILTRSGDETVSLPERIDRAREADAHFFISLHNNATTPWGDPLRARGTSTYYALSQDRNLAWTLYPFLIDLGLAPYGRVHNTYYVTLTPDMLVVLLEGAFLTHPEDEVLLANGSFTRRLAEAVYKGLEEFLGNLR